MWTKLLPAALTFPLLLAGCNGGPANSSRSSESSERIADSSSSKEGKVQANLAKLSPEDRKLAEDQKYCPNEPDTRLGAMGVPVKVMVKDQPVFLCCKSCRNEVLAHPDETLAKVRELKSKNAGKSGE